MAKNITVYIEDDYGGLSRKAAEVFAQRVKNSPLGAFGFATGSTPEGMYAELIKMHGAGDIDLSRVTAFNLDEYFPIKRDDPQSYSYFMAKKLFDVLGLPEEKRNIPSGEAADPKAECDVYEGKIAMAGGIELQILGIGHNGHIGFNEPAESFAGKTNYVSLAETTIEANARFFAHPSDVPRHAITMGIRTIMMANSIMLLAGGEGKADILRDALFGPITPLVPASALQLHRDVIVVADKAAAKYL